MPVIPALGSLKEGSEFEPNLGYNSEFESRLGCTVKPCFKQTKNTLVYKRRDSSCQGSPVREESGLYSRCALHRYLVRSHFIPVFFLAHGCIKTPTQSLL
jgi:hypothetical protein